MKGKFPIFKAHPELIYLDTAATAHKPQSVIDALCQFYGSAYATVHRGAYQASVLATDQYNASRAAVQRFLNARHPEEIVFTRGATEGINLVSQSYGLKNLKRGDEILISQMEHHSNTVPWQMLAAQTGASLRSIPVQEDGTLDWKPYINEKTRIIALAHVSNVTGTILPIAEIAKAAHAVGAIILVDGAQAASHMKIDVQALDCDFYVFSGHKCYGPTGIGALYGKLEILESMPPVSGGGGMIEQVGPFASTYEQPPLRFEAGTPNIGSAIGMRAALEFIESIGLDAIGAHESALLKRLEEKLSEIPDLKIIGQAENKGPISTFHIEGIHPLDLASFLDLRSIAIRSGHLCAQPLLQAFGLKAASRVSFGIYNTQQDVDLLVDAVRECVQKISI